MYEIFLSQKGYPDDKSLHFGPSLHFMHFKQKHCDGSWEAFQIDRTVKTLAYSAANQLLLICNPWLRGGRTVCANYPQKCMLSVQNLITQK